MRCEVFLTEELSQPVRLVVVLHGHRAGVEEDQDDDKPEPGRGLNNNKLSRENKTSMSTLYFAAAPYEES